MRVTTTFFGVALALCVESIPTSNTDGLQMPCEIPSTPLGHPTILTCHYNENILESKEKVAVLHYCQNDEENPDLHNTHTTPVTSQSDDYPLAVIISVAGAIAFICSGVIGTIIGIFVRSRCAPGDKKCKTDEKTNNCLKGNGIQTEVKISLEEMEELIIN